MNYVSLCAVVKNEAPYLYEWIKYHHHLGVERFYLYENYSTDCTYQILKKLQSDYPIDIERTNVKGCQLPSYNVCLHKHKMDTRWLIFLDVDEFLAFPMPQDRDTKNYLQKFLANYEKHLSLAVHWYLFGSNGWDVQSLSPVTERFTKREAHVNPHIKSIVWPEHVTGVHTPHTFQNRFGFSATEWGVEIKDTDPKPANGTCDLIQCNHYATKSYEECALRRSRPRADVNSMAEREMPKFFNLHDKNDVEDFKARDIWRSIP